MRHTRKAHNAIHPYRTSDDRIMFDPVRMGEMSQHDPEERITPAPVWKSIWRRDQAERERKRRRRDWLWAGVFVGVVIAIPIALTAWAIWH